MVQICEVDAKLAKIEGQQLPITEKSVDKIAEADSKLSADKTPK